MHALEIACAPEEREHLVAELWEHGTLGVVEREEGLIAYFGDEHAARAAAAALGAHSSRLSRVPECDWDESWRARWRPCEVGKKFFLAPEWSEEPTPPGRIRLLVRPGRACGTGLHPCTRLCLELLEDLVKPGYVVLDVGTGSGLLAAAAAQLGAGRVIACDISEEATAEAGERFRREAPGVLLFQGSLRSLRPRSADLVVVNISAAAALELAPEIRRVAKPGGIAVLSGFRVRAFERLRAPLDAIGLRPRRARELEGWQALVCYTC